MAPKNKTIMLLSAHLFATPQVLTYNLSSDVVGPRFGMLVPITYYHLGNDKEEMEKAHILGWCVELLRASKVRGDHMRSLLCIQNSVTLFDGLSYTLEQRLNIN